MCRFCNRELNGASNEDRALLAMEMKAYSDAGYRIAAQNETGFQAVKPKAWSATGLLFLVVVPLLLSCFGTLLFGYGALVLALVAVVGLVIVAAAYLTANDVSTYVTAEGVRYRLQKAAAQAQIIAGAGNGRPTCSKCQGYVRADATQCKHCGETFATPLGQAV